MCSRWEFWCVYLFLYQRKYLEIHTYVRVYGFSKKRGNFSDIIWQKGLVCTRISFNTLVAWWDYKISTWFLESIEITKPRAKKQHYKSAVAQKVKVTVKWRLKNNSDKNASVQCGRHSEIRAKGWWSSRKDS